MIGAEKNSVVLRIARARVAPVSAVEETEADAVETEADASTS